MEVWDLISSSFVFLIDFILNIDEYLYSFVAEYGRWIYLLLFIIIFIETGLVVMPFLPGDSLLFVVGAMAGVGIIDYPLASLIMFTAAVLGDQCNYTIGKWFGPKVFGWENSRLFNRKAFDSAHQFYEKYGGFTVIAARFMPFIRTFVPFVAGVASMRRSQFILFNFIGAALWIFGVTLLGYLFGGIDIVQKHFEKVIWALILIPGSVVMLGALKAVCKSKNSKQVQ